MSPKILSISSREITSSGFCSAGFSSWFALDSLLTSIFQPVSLAARRTFLPPFPIASESLSSGTITLADFTEEKGTIEKEVEVNDVNDDSLGADFFDISKLSKDELSAIAILELEKLGYKLK